MNCTGCDKTTEAKRLPPGWHRDVAENPFCPACWHERYTIRAVTIPVAGPVGREWKELREAVKSMWQATTRLSNWAVSEMAKDDVTRLPEMEKLPKFEGRYLYPDARRIAPELPSTSTTAVLHAVSGKYRSKRFNVIWLGDESLPNYRYPTPFPSHNQSWKAVLGDDGEALIQSRIGSERWTLRLRGGHQFRRQLEAHAQLANGRAIKGELVLYQQRANSSDNRAGLSDRDGGGQQFATRLMCKMVAWMPKHAARERSGVLFVGTDADSMLLAMNAKNNRLWTIHGDHVVRWEAERKRRNLAMSDDRKMESRRSKRLESRQQAMAAKFRNRWNTAADQMAAQAVNYAHRYRFAEVRFIDDMPRRIDAFCWHRLKGRIQTKCEELGIVFQEIKSENLQAE